MSEPSTYLRAEDGSAKHGGKPGWTEHTFFVPGLFCVVYLLVMLAVVAVEYISEMSKLSRGFSTDTFSPFFYAHVLSFPTSVVHSDWPGYPEVFNEGQWKGVVRQAVGPVVLMVVIQAALVAALCWLVVSLSRWMRRRSSKA